MADISTAVRDEWILWGLVDGLYTEELCGNDRKDLSSFTANLLMQYIMSRPESINIHFNRYKQG